MGTKLPTNPYERGKMRISGFYLIFILLFGQLIYADEFYNAIMSGDKDLALKVLLLAENKNKLNDGDLGLMFSLQ